MIRFGICFSNEFRVGDPLSQLGKKKPVYKRLLEFCQKEGWETYVLTRRTYLGSGTFRGCWLFKNGEFKKKGGRTKIDIIYDRTGGVSFPPENDNLSVVNSREFKILCWDKWFAYKLLADEMPKTVWVGEKDNLKGVLKEISTDWIVLKPFNGMKGHGVYIGDKDKARDFEFNEKYDKYIAQEFVDTSNGIPGITPGLHDLRVAIVNHLPVWCHVRTPPEGTYQANVARGGDIHEVDYEKVPDTIKTIVSRVAAEFSKKYDNPVYSLDFGMGEGRPYIFEINDAIGFPLWEMKNRDLFLGELVKNFKLKIQ